MSGLDLIFTKRVSDTKTTTASLDRIDSSKGYIKGNIQWIYKDLNLIKQNFEQKYFIDLCNKIANFNINNIQEFPNENTYGVLTNDYMRSLKISAKKRNLAFNLNKDELWNLFIKQRGICAISGIFINLHYGSLVKKNFGSKTASVDRINSNQNYIIENVQWVHKDINKIKHKYNQEYFIKLCRLVAEYQIYKNQTI